MTLAHQGIPMMSSWWEDVHNTFCLKQQDQEIGGYESDKQDKSDKKARDDR